MLAPEGYNTVEFKSNGKKEKPGRLYRADYYERPTRTNAAHASTQKQKP